MTSVLVLHDVGAEGGGPWRAAFDTSWPGPVAAPDLPGHGDAPGPVGGSYERGDAVFAVVDHLPAPDEDQPVVVGVGRNGHAAQVLALGGRASALVLVDGLGGPWLGAHARNAAVRASRRAVLFTPAALDRHVPGTTDPRATLVPGSNDRAHVVRMLEAMPVPTLVIETSRSPTPDAEVLVRSIPHGELRRTRTDEPATLVATVVEWWLAVAG